MPSVEASILIDKPRDEVWEFLIDPDNLPVYASNIIEYELVSGDKHEVGRRSRGAVRMAGRRLEFTDELVEVEPGRRARIASVQATIPYTLTVTYDDGEGGATKVTWHQEVQSLKGFLKFADPMVVKLYSRDARSNLVKAKAILES
jgi:uncharacterized membrane protein